MAKKEEQAAAEVSEVSAAPSRKKKILILAIIGLLVLTLIGGGALFLLKKKDKKAESHGEGEEEAVTEHVKEKKKTPPVFSKLDTFTVNLVQETGDQYLQVAITIELEDMLVDAALKASMPKIRDSIIRLLASKKASELSTTEGKDGLALELKDALNLLLAPPDAAPKKGKSSKKKKSEIEGPVSAVLFTDFIIQ